MGKFPKKWLTTKFLSTSIIAGALITLGLQKSSFLANSDSIAFFWASTYWGGMLSTIMILIGASLFIFSQINLCQIHRKYIDNKVTMLPTNLLIYVGSVLSFLMGFREKLYCLISDGVASYFSADGKCIILSILLIFCLLIEKFYEQYLADR